MQSNHSLTKGFTLVEIMIVMILLGILFAMGVGAFVSSQKKGRDVRRKSDIANISKALEAYYNDKSKYPAGNSGKMMGCFLNDAQECSWGKSFQDRFYTIYMTVLPADPTPANNYYYSACTGCGPNNTEDGFQLYALLENTDDANLIRDELTNAVQYYTGTDCGGGKRCNWGISSQNITLIDGGHTLVATP